MNTFYTNYLLYQSDFLCYFLPYLQCQYRSEVTQRKSLKLHECYPCTGQEKVDSLPK